MSYEKSGICAAVQGIVARGHISWPMFSKFLRSILECTLIVLVFSCGKKAEDAKRTTMERQTGPVITDMDEYLEKQELGCEAGEACPNYIAKMAVLNGGSVKFCTGYLVQGNIIATSSSCLTNVLRLNNQDCTKDVHFYFASSFNRKAERVGCKQVVLASQLEVKDPKELWRDDVSFLEMQTSLRSRRVLSFNREGMFNHKEYAVWGVEQVDEHNAFIRRQNCEVIHHSYINPLVSKETSPGMVLSGCTFKNGYTGGPIVDGRGKVRGSISQPMSPKIREYLESTGLLTNPLKEMVHATNFSCAPTHLDSEVADEKECLKEIDYSILDRLRNEMLSREGLFNELKTKFEQKLSDSSKYLNFNINITIEGETGKIQVLPKCFKNIGNWISRLNTARNAYSYEMKVPNTIFKRSMDQYGRTRSSEITEGEIGYFVQFSPKTLKNSRSSNVFIWNNAINLSFPKITESCL